MSSNNDDDLDLLRFQEVSLLDFFFAIFYIFYYSCKIFY